MNFSVPFSLRLPSLVAYPLLAILTSCQSESANANNTTAYHIHISVEPTDADLYLYRVSRRVDGEIFDCHEVLPTGAKVRNDFDMHVGHALQHVPVVVLAKRAGYRPFAVELRPDHDVDLEIQMRRSDEAGIGMNSDAEALGDAVTTFLMPEKERVSQQAMLNGDASVAKFKNTVVVKRDEFEKQTSLNLHGVFFDTFSMYTLQVVKGDNERVSNVQLVVQTTRPFGETAYWKTAKDADGVTFDIEQLSEPKIVQPLGTVKVLEQVAAIIPRKYLQSHSESGTHIRVYGSEVYQDLTISSTYIKAFLEALQDRGW